MNDIGIGALTSGLAQGFGQGYRLAGERADRNMARELQQRHLGIMEENAGLQRQVVGNQIKQQDRALAKQQREEDAHRQALQLLTQGSGVPVDPNLPADQQVSRMMVGGGAFRNPAVLNEVAKVYATAGLPEAVKWMEHGYKADRENVLDMVDALKRGDTKAAVDAYNQRGSQQITGIKPAEGKEGTPTGRYRVKFKDGEEGEIDPDQIARSVFSFSEWRDMQEAGRKAQREGVKDQADINLKGAQAEHALAQAEKDRGANETELEKARIAASAKGKGKGSGSGSGGGDGEGGDPFGASAKRRVEIQKEMDEYVGRNFGKVDQVDSNKWTHTPESRKAATIATQLLMASMEGGRPMAMPDAARAAQEGQSVYTYPELKGGRLVLSQMWEHNGVQYPMGSAEKDASVEQTLGYLDAVGAMARHKGATAADLMKADDIKLAAKQAGITPEQAVKRMLEGAPAAPAKGKGSAPGMIEAGNIDLTKRKVLNNPDGSISTESSITITEKGEDGKEIAVNLPTVIDGKRMSDKDAVAYYKRTGEHLGKFASIKEAESAAQNTHLDQEKRYASPARAGIAAESARLKELEDRLTDLRDKEGTIRRSGDAAAATGISREIKNAERDLGGITARGWKSVRAKLDKVNAEIQEIESGKMRGAPGRYRDTLLRKKAALEQRLRDESPTSGISREQLR